MSDAPRVETERLILRGRKAEDFDAYAALWADPEVTRYAGGSPLSREDAWAKFARAAGMWALLGYGFWSVEEKATGEVVGDAGLADMRRDMTPSLDGKLECGWAFARRTWGRGYATEAMRAALAWGDFKFRGRTFSAIINPDNGASVRVAEKLGFRQAALGLYKNAPTLVFERPAG